MTVTMTSKQVTKLKWILGQKRNPKPAGEKAHKASHLFSVVNRCIKQQAFLWERRQTKHSQNTQSSSNRDRMEHSICLLGLMQQPEMRNCRKISLHFWGKWVLLFLFYFINLCNLHYHLIIYFYFHCLCMCAYKHTKTRQNVFIDLNDQLSWALL